MKILHIDSSTTGGQSVTRELTKAIVDHFLAQHPDAAVTTLDLVLRPLPHLDPVSTAALRLPPEAQDEAMKVAYPVERAVFDQFVSSDIVVIGAPMYNFTIPSQLKVWLDRLALPGVAFSYSAAGPKGLAGGRRVIIASSQGGMYGDGDPSEHQESLLRAFFGLIGIPDLEIIRADKIGFGPEARAASISQAKAEIAKL
ncbi:NAD(P)H-dependent oxidoreductase [Niveispirillum sp. BGYR6]|uniref:FMN-dependent NADH-azoreductase n=1 Tax=Niveispirillum sp. BGYR6 TaxID=2971249 RepID=UPI0022B9A565|nr:NAD(P)H-dependent oxidoreductase [Niveispirillum sp. BGYR6]MDG5497513.1 NAD(P)H-dependent oxidoreductase [Niveispirillum sp. BGYR6]